MDNHNKKVFNWVVKQGNIVVFVDNYRIHLEINKGDHSTCLLTRDDAEELISILTNISGDIWDNPNYTREPYTGKLYLIDNSGKAYWDTGETRLFLGLNNRQDALEMTFQGNPVMKLPVNLSIEIIQIMTQFSSKI